MQSIWRGISCGVSGKGVGGPILHSRDVHHGKSVTECLLLEVPEAGVTDVQ